MKPSSILAIAFAIVSTSHAGNIAVNPGFEIAGPGGAADSAGWVTSGSGTSERDASMPASGDWAHRLFSDNSQVAVVQRTGIEGGLPSLLPGSLVHVDIDIKSINGGNLIVGILNGIGGTVVDPGNPVLLPDSGGDYTTYSIDSMIVPDFGAPPNDYFQVGITLLVAPNLGESAELFIDNVVIDATLVPEPSGVVPLVVGIGVLWRRRLA